MTFPDILSEIGILGEIYNCSGKILLSFLSILSNYKDSRNRLVENKEQKIVCKSKTKCSLKRNSTIKNKLRSNARQPVYSPVCSILSVVHC